MEGKTKRAPRDGRTLSRVRAVSRAVAILRSFSVDKPRRTLSEIAETTGLDAGTTRRILVTLKDEGLIQQDAGGRYSLTLSVLELAGAVPDGVSLKDLVDARLRQLAADTGTTAYLSVVNGDEALCLTRHHGDRGIEVRWWSVGESMPLNCGAGPRVLLAHLPVDRQNAILAGPMGRLTEQTETDPVALRRDLEDIARRGWIIARDDVAHGLSAMAMPLKNARGDTVAAVSIGGLTPHITGDTGQNMLRALGVAIQDMQRSVRAFSAGSSSGEIEVAG